MRDIFNVSMPNVPPDPYFKKKYMTMESQINGLLDMSKSDYRVDKRLTHIFM